MMTDKTGDRTDSARVHDDRALIEDAEDAPGTASRSGGKVATDVGTRDEARRALEPDAGVTGVEKGDEAKRGDTPGGRPGRSDHQGGQG